MAGRGIILGVRSIGLTVSDLDRSVAFFTAALSFELAGKISRLPPDYGERSGLSQVEGRSACLRLGDEVLDLIEYDHPRGRPIDPTSRSHDHWFQHVAIVVRDMPKAHAHILAHGARPLSVAPQRLPDWNPAAGGIKAFYFQDPDRHNLELIFFPPGKGDDRWQTPGDTLFLGIDHTAVVVAETARSLAFYRDALGLALAGKSENYGPEQEALNHVSGAHLRISGLQARRGPGIELLEYISPQDGRKTPPDLAVFDLVHWEIRLLVRDVAAARAAALAAGAQAVTSDLGRVHGDDARQAVALVRDPDGHGIRFEISPDLDAKPAE
jgi:catechol 2,3-dioxygenase-like lactoylglutathione lyase family enzyme